MASVTSAKIRTETLHLRLTTSAKKVLQTAASVKHQSVSDFVLESALSYAAETLPDRQHFGLDVERWKAFQAALDAPPRSMPRLSGLLREADIFERDL